MKKCNDDRLRCDSGRLRGWSHSWERFAKPRISALRLPPLLQPLLALLCDRRRSLGRKHPDTVFAIRGQRKPAALGLFC